MRNYLLFISLTLVVTTISSCGSSTSAPDTSTEVEAPDTAFTDTIAAIDSLPVFMFSLGVETEVVQLPFNLDSTYLADNINRDENPVIDYKTVQALTSKMLDNEMTEYTSYYIETFFRIDSIKRDGSYEEFCSGLDIGQMKETDAFMLESIQISESDRIQLWYITYSTYEACPYASGTLIYGTYISNDVVRNTSLLAEESGGGDAPYWGSTLNTSTVKAGSVQGLVIDESGGDEDEDGNEIIEHSEKKWKLILSSEGFEIAN